VRLFTTQDRRVTAAMRIDDIGLLSGVSYLGPNRLLVLGYGGARLLSVPNPSPVGTPVSPRTLASGDRAVVDVTADARRAAIATARQTTIEVRDLAGGKTVGQIQAPCPLGVFELAWSHAGDVLAVTCEGLDAALIDPLTGKVIAQTVLGPGPGGAGIMFSDDDKVVAVAGFTAASLYSRDALKPIASGIPMRGGRPYSMTFSHDGRVVAIGDDQGGVVVWDVAGARRVGELIGVEEGVGGLVLLGSSDHVQLLVGTQSTVSEWDLSKPPPLAKQLGDGHNVVFVDAHGRLYESTADHLGLRVVDADGRVESEVKTGGNVSYVRASPDGRTVVTSSDPAGQGPNAQPIDELRHLPDGAVMRSLAGAFRPGVSTFLRYSPDSRRFVLLSTDGLTEVRDVATGQVVARGRTDANVSNVGFTADSRFLITGGGTGVLRTWDFASGFRSNVAITIGAGFSISGIDLIPGTNRLAVTTEAGEVWIADLARGRVIGAPFRWGGPQMRSGVLSPDGRYLAAISRDGGFRVWDVPRHTVLGPAVRAFDRGDFAQLVFTGPDTIVAWDGLGAAEMWRIDIDGWIKTACELAGRPLAQDEWGQYIPNEPYSPSCRGSRPK
jgi:WD40 repeat protein